MEIQLSSSPDARDLSHPFENRMVHIADMGALSSSFGIATDCRTQAARFISQAVGNSHREAPVEIGFKALRRKSVFVAISGSILIVLRAPSRIPAICRYVIEFPRFAQE